MAAAAAERGGGAGCGGPNAFGDSAAAGAGIEVDGIVSDIAGGDATGAVAEPKDPMAVIMEAATAGVGVAGGDCTGIDGLAGASDQGSAEVEMAAAGGEAMASNHGAAEYEAWEEAMAAAAVMAADAEEELDGGNAPGPAEDDDDDIEAAASKQGRSDTRGGAAFASQSPGATAPVAPPLPTPEPMLPAPEAAASAAKAAALPQAAPQAPGGFRTTSL